MPYHESSEYLKIEHRVLTQEQCQAILRISFALFGNDVGRHITLYNITDRRIISRQPQANKITHATFWDAIKGFVLKQDLPYEENIVEYIVHISGEHATQVRFNNEKERSMVTYTLNLFKLPSYRYQI